MAAAAVGGVPVVAVGQGWLSGTEHRPAVLAPLGAAVAVLVVARERVPRRLVRVAWWVLGVVTILSTLGTRVPIEAEMLVLVGAAALGAAVAFAAGTPSRAPTAAAVRAGLERVGLRSDEVAPAAVDARASVPLTTVAIVYLAGSAVGAAAPTPGGLGALEATLVAGLTATSVGQSEALAAVLVFRLATFWLPILPGWASFVALQRRGWL